MKLNGQKYHFWQMELALLQEAKNERGARWHFDTCHACCRKCEMCSLEKISRKPSAVSSYLHLLASRHISVKYKNRVYSSYLSIFFPISTLSQWVSPCGGDNDLIIMCECSPGVIMGDVTHNSTHTGKNTSPARLLMYTFSSSDGQVRDIKGEAVTQSRISSLFWLPPVYFPLWVFPSCSGSVSTC